MVEYAKLSFYKYEVTVRNVYCYFCFPIFNFFFFYLPFVVSSVSLFSFSLLSLFLKYWSGEAILGSIPVEGRGGGGVARKARQFKQCAFFD